MEKDVVEETKEKEKKEQQEEKKISWFQKVPMVFKLGGIGILFFKYQSLVKTGGDFNEIWIWVIAVIALWYVLGSEGKRRTSGILTAAEAEEILREEVERKKKEGQIERWDNIYYGPNNGLFIQEGIPQHYQIEMQIMSENKREFKRGIVFAAGDTKGIVTIQDSVGRLTGREPIPVRTPQIFKELKKYDIDMDKFIFGAEKR